MTYSQQETGYGGFKGGDPNNFHPDAECCSEAELDRHREACAKWDGTAEPFPGCGKSPFGIGIYVTYWHEDFSPKESNDDVREEIDDE